jgi:SAM-dependent methyltransferase
MNVMYCAFSTPNFTVAPKEAQRDAGKRVAHFGLTAENVRGKSVLDLGSNAGAMLFQLSNFAPRAGLGIEYDRDKVDLANEIAAHAAIPDVRFEQGDLDKLTVADIGVHDIVLALAIEGHVNNPERLYRLLGEVTGELLCFEGNSNCDMAAARKHLKAAGFTRMVDLGFCDDDRDPRNNRRPQLLARKRRRLFVSR